MPVYNLTPSKKVPPLWGEVIAIGRDINYEHPFEAGLWYPAGGFTTNKYYHYLVVFLFQWIPALFIDFLLMCFFQKRLLVNIVFNIPYDVL